MDLRKIKKLIELVEESGIAELEVRDGEEAIRIARPVTAPGGGPATSPRAAGAADSPQPVPAGGLSVRAPMAGTFYAAPEPGAEPFVRVGQRVAAGAVLCIIESMKMMNEIVAEAPGLVTVVAAQNGQAVASGQVLFQLD